MKITIMILAAALVMLRVGAQAGGPTNQNQLTLFSSNIHSLSFVFDPETMTIATCYVARVASNAPGAHPSPSSNSTNR